MVRLELVRLDLELEPLVRQYVERKQLVGLELVGQQLVWFHVERQYLVERLVDGGELGLGGNRRDGIRPSSSRQP